MLHWQEIQSTHLVKTFNGVSKTHVGWEGLGYVFKKFITESKKKHQLYQNSLHLKTSPTANSHLRASQTQAYQTEI